MEQQNSESNGINEPVLEGKVITSNFLLDLVAAIKNKDTEALRVISTETFEKTSQSFHQEPKRMIFWPTFYEACEGNKLFKTMPSSRKKGDSSHQDKGDTNAKQTEAIFNFFRTRHIFAMSGFAQQNNGFIAASDVLDHISSYVMKNLFQMNIPNSLLWSIMSEHMFVLECAYNSQRASEISAFRLDEIMSRLKKIVNDSGILEKVHLPLAGLTSCLMDVSDTRCKHVLGMFAQIVIAHIHVSVCDYRAAIKAFTDIALFGNGGLVLAKVDTEAFVRVHYLAGFSFMMCRRYRDAIQSFDQAANVECDSRYKLKLEETEERKPKSQRETMERLMRKSAKLMVVCAVVSGETDVTTPFFVESESDIQDLRSLSGSPDLKSLGALFYDNAPVFIRVVRHADEQQVSVLVEQRKVFLRQMEQQLAADRLRGYFRTYTSLTIDKLNNMMFNTHTNSSTSTVKSRNVIFPIAQLVAAKKSSTQIVRNTAEGAEQGSTSWAICTPMQFRVEGDCVIPVSKEKNSIELLVQRINDAKRS
eukprot:Tbor_TRINITY_DN5915_c0_g3::TRINITY_DN5915_c0_g3_i1::g.18886::m.18886/K15029/EIF3L; translation initiation factor 3 subunit L